MSGVAGCGPMIRPWPNRRTLLRVARYLSTLAAQFLHACSDHREIIGGTGPDYLAQFLNARSDLAKSSAARGRVVTRFLRSRCPHGLRLPKTSGLFDEIVGLFENRDWDRDAQ